MLVQMEIVFAVVYIDTSCSKMLQVKRKQRGLPLNYPDRGVVPLVHITEVVVFTTCQICWGNWLAVHCHKVQGNDLLMALIVSVVRGYGGGRG